MVYFVGAGCGAADLITVRGMRLLLRADVIIYAGSLVNPELLLYAKEDCEVYNSARLTLREVVEIMEEAEIRGKMTVRLHTGDASVYGTVREQMDELEKLGIAYESCPGVSACFGAAASLNLEYTLPGVSQSLIITRMEGRTEVPKSESVESFAAHRASMAIYLSAGMLEELGRRLILGGYREDTPAALVHRATWPEEAAYICTVGTLCETGRKYGITKTALVLVGDAVTHRKYQRSRLYAPDFSTGYREARGCAADFSAGSGESGRSISVFSEEGKEPLQRESALFEEGKELLQRESAFSEEGKEPLQRTSAFSAKGKETLHNASSFSTEDKEAVRLSIISFTENGGRLSEKIAGQLGGMDKMEVRLYTKCRAYSGAAHTGRRLTEPVDTSVSVWAGERMRERSALLFVGACGIAVRAIAPHLTDKLRDVPVLVMDEKARYVIPVLSGHVGGANELAALLAEVTGAEQVITTATDLNGRFAVDLFAKKNGLAIVNREGIAKVSAKVLAGEEIVIFIERGHREAGEVLPAGVRVTEDLAVEAADVVVASAGAAPAGTLLLRPREYVIGMGCKKGKPEREIEALIAEKLEELGISTEQISALASISQKEDEAGLVSWCRKENIPFLTYTAGELREVEGAFESSRFVEAQMGVDNVCERAAIKACGGAGQLISGKYAKDGMTIAVARKEWHVSFSWEEEKYNSSKQRKSKFWQKKDD